MQRKPDFFFSGENVCLVVFSSSSDSQLNVGGTKYITTKTTLRKYPHSMLGAMFMENIPLSTDKDGNYFIDRPGHIFQYILQFLRCGKLVLPKGFNELELLQVEADFYQIEKLISAIEDHKRITEIKEDDGNAALFITSHSSYFEGDFRSVYKRKKKQTN